MTSLLIKLQFSLYGVKSYQEHMTSNTIHRNSKKPVLFHERELFTTNQIHKKTKQNKTKKYDPLDCLGCKRRR